MHAQAERRLVGLAREQYGAFSRVQAIECGFTARAVDWRVTSGRWEPVLPGVYRVAGAPESWRQRVIGGCLWGGTAAVASHRSAGRLWRLDGFEVDAIAEVTVPYGTNERVEGITVHRTRRLNRADRSVRDGIPVTAVERTLVDLAAVVDEEALEIALESAFRMGLTSVGRLWRRTEQLAGRRGLRSVRRILALRQPGMAHSRWEVKLLRLIRAAGLPAPVRQHTVWDGARNRWIDLAYPALLVGLEYDSFTHHSGRRAWERDHTRNSELVSRGWRILAVTMDDVERRPERTVSRIARLIGA